MECPFKHDCKNCSYYDPQKLKSKHGCTFHKWWIGETELKYKAIEPEKFYGNVEFENLKEPTKEK